MTNIEELIQVTNNLCATLDKASQDEKMFCQDICHEFERMSWETMRMSNDIKQIKERYL